MGIDNTYGTLGLRPGVCTSTSRPGSPFDGQVIYETDTNTLAVYDGTSWTSLNPVDRDRNVIMNGAMQVHQRGTSTTGITTSGYYTADRWTTIFSSLGTWTNSIETDAPTGSGLRKSFRMLCTTADSSPSSTDVLFLEQKFEGQNMQKFKKGTSSAEKMTLSFWVKSNVTGTYIIEFYDNDNSRSRSAAYSINASGTWERKVITIDGDTSGVLDNDNNHSFSVYFWLGSGSTYTSGTLNTSWGSLVNANRVPGQVNLASATNNYWQITGVQFETGATATPFEFEDYSTTLAKCQRYFQRMVIPTNSIMAQYGSSPNTFYAHPISYAVPMRIAPNISYVTHSSNWYWVIVGTAAHSAISTTGLAFETTVDSFRVTQTRQAGFAAVTSGNVYVLEAGPTFDITADL